MTDTLWWKKGGSYVEETRNSNVGSCDRFVPRR
jgi:hypothetical protein